VNCAGLILAAGESRRMGSPKALLMYRGETFLDGLIGRFAARCSPVVVVLGAAAEEIGARVRRSATLVYNERYRLGQTTSMQCGLKAMPAGIEGVLFTLVDHPAVASATIEALTGDSGADDPLPRLRVPRYKGKRGHPIWFSSSLITEFLALPEDGAARDVVRAHADHTEFLDVDDAGVLADIDDPEAYRVLVGARA